VQLAVIHSNIDANFFNKSIIYWKKLSQAGFLGHLFLGTHFIYTRETSYEHVKITTFVDKQEPQGSCCAFVCYTVYKETTYNLWLLLERVTQMPKW